MHIRTWHLELGVVALVLSIVALLTSNNLVQWIGVGAVTLTFAHAQVATRLAEREEQRGRTQAAVECYYMAQHYFVGKELLWLCYFTLLQAWTALVGVGLFLVYPFWRRWWRQHHPLGSRTKWTWKGPYKPSTDVGEFIAVLAEPTKQERAQWAADSGDSSCSACGVAWTKHHYTCTGSSYEEMKSTLQALVRAGKLSATPTREERIDFAYSNVKLSNPAVTRKMVEEAADRLDREAKGQPTE